MRITGDANQQVPNGPSLAAFLAAGIGAFALGFVVVLNEVGLFSPPALYAPAGGVSTRTTIAALVWLIAWVALHNRWKERDIAPWRIHALALVLTGLGILLTFPPLWTLIG